MGAAAFGLPATLVPVCRVAALTLIAEEVRGAPDRWVYNTKLHVTTSPLTGAGRRAKQEKTGKRNRNGCHIRAYPTKRARMRCHAIIAETPALVLSSHKHYT